MTPRHGVVADDALGKELREQVATQIGALAGPEEIRFAEALPKTRSGKIMRRLLREVASGSKARGGDVSITVANTAALATLVCVFAATAQTATIPASALSTLPAGMGGMGAVSDVATTVIAGGYRISVRASIGALDPNGIPWATNATLQ